ncbi:MAG TPA: sigma-70 family RNA polymerase sigma factor, partial [Candidatus Limiplasma sp.]|nr:sigma-70 family RNA polymerase sigma factor [Candidatus Limiplasma sp.]
WVMLHDRELARDTVQETFLKAYRSLPTLRQGDTEKAWLTRIAVNTCRDMLRSRWWRMVNRTLTPDDLPEPACDAEMPDGTALTAVTNLPQKYREVVWLHYYQQMPLAEIARALNLPASTVRSRLLRAKEKLYRKLEGWYFDE